MANRLGYTDTSRDDCGDCAEGSQPALLSTMRLKHPERSFRDQIPNWRYDSRLVPGAVPCSAPTGTCFASTPIADGGGADLPSGQVALVNAVNGAPLTADQEFQAGLTCNGRLAAPNPLGTPLATCSASGPGALYVKVPAPGTENDDHNPQRIQPRNLFDMSVGHDNVFHGDRYKWSARLSVINLANKVAHYNFLSTFSGTHYVSPADHNGNDRIPFLSDGNHPACVLAFSANCT